MRKKKLVPNKTANCAECFCKFTVMYPGQRFCSRECSGSYSKLGEWVRCSVCGTLVYRQLRSIQRNKSHVFFCSGECRVKNLNLTTTTKRTSKYEISLASVLEKTGYTVVRNDRLLLEGLELDVYIPDIKVAIEVNGPTHYTPIYGTNSFEAQIKRDRQKRILCHEKGIKLLTIPTSGPLMEKDIPDILEKIKG